MAKLPIIFVADFDVPNTSYRIATNRCKTYCELVALTHRVFRAPPEIWDAHIHLESGQCSGRIAECEWNDAAYFDEEFVCDGRLVLYVHFEEWERESEDEGRVEGFEIEVEGTSGLEGEEMDGYVKSQTICGANSQTTIKEEIGANRCDDQDTQHLTESACNKERTGWPAQERSTPGFSFTNIANRQWERSFTPTRFSTAPPGLVFSPDHAPQSIVRSSPTVSTITTIDECTSKSLLQLGIIVGRARPCVCRSPYERPIARAIVSSGKAPQVRIYIPSKYSNHPVKRKGLVQVRSSEVDYIEEFARLAPGYRRTDAIMKAVQRSNNNNRAISLEATAV